MSPFEEDLPESPSIISDKGRINETNVNRLFSGMDLSKMLKRPFLAGYIGHVFLSGDAPKSLAGPVFGYCSEEYEGNGIDGEWVLTGETAP